MVKGAELLGTLKKVQHADANAALATIIRVQGSAYRREGAKLLIDAEGRYTGMISGGCLEADVAATAMDVLAHNRPMRKVYGLDEELVWGLGLGCPGVVEILVEPLALFVETELFHRWLNAMEQGVPAVLCTRLDGPELPSVCLRMLVHDSGAAAGDLGDDMLTEAAMRYAQEKLSVCRARSECRRMPIQAGGQVEVFFDVYVPPAEVLIYGAGQDAIPLAQLSVLAGYPTTVVDPRPAFNSVERFPSVKRVIAEPDASAIAITERTHVVIMNHHLDRDRTALRRALASSAPYIGLLGPRSRGKRLLEDLVQEGMVLSPDHATRLHSPIGLDIGADGPAEIALSIMAEITAKRNGHEGGFLRNHGHIHRPAHNETGVW